MIELRRRLVGFGRPALSSIVRHARPAVIGHNHPLRMRRIDPQGVIVAMRDTNDLETFSAVGGAVNAGVEHVDGVGIFGVRKKVMKIPGALREAVVRVDEFPAFASIFAPVKSAFFRLNDGVHSIPIRARHGNADSPQHSAWQPMPF